jgi:hypothetical protein
MPLHSPTTRVFAQLLVECGADTRARNRPGPEPLHAATVGGPGTSHWDPQRQRAVIEYLVEVGAAVLLGHAAVQWLFDSQLGWPLWFDFGIALVVPFMIGLVANRTRVAPFLTGRESGRPIPLGSVPSRHAGMLAVRDDQAQ